MATFTDEHKQERDNVYFGEGVHKVTIKEIAGDETDSGKEFFEFTVQGENGEEGTARIWFTTDKAIAYSFNVVRQMFVHNTVEAKRDEVRKRVDACKDTDELLKLAQALVGKEAWYTVYKSERTYVNGAGERKHSYDRDIYGYKPKPKETNILEDLANATPVTNSDEIPFE